MSTQQTVSNPIRPISAPASLLLDVVRLLAALIVAFGHLTQPYFSTGWVNRTNVAQGAVTVFFILSGFVIRHVTLLKPTSLAQYGIDRASRIYSVVLPAILFTYLADFASKRVNPGFYLPAFGPFYNHFFSRLLVAVLFVGETWHKDVYLLSNSPFWSLSYECFYYLIYGLAFYLTGARRIVLVALACLIAGPGILLAMPLWLLGCLLHTVYQNVRGSSNAIRLLATIILGASLAFVLSPPLRLGAVRLTAWMYQHVSYHRALGSQFVIAVPVFLLLLFGLLGLDSLRINLKSRSSKTIRYAAEATFPLYLFHFPLFVLIYAVTSYNRANSTTKFGMLLFAFCLSIVLGDLLNRLKFQMRSWFGRVQSLAGPSEWLPRRGKSSLAESRQP